MKLTRGKKLSLDRKVMLDQRQSLSPGLCEHPTGGGGGLGFRNGGAHVQHFRIPGEIIRPTF